MCPVKMEYGPEISIFGLKYMIKSGIEKNIFEILPCASCFLIDKWIYNIKKHQVRKSVMKMTFFAHGGISIKKNCDVCTYD